MTAPVWFWQRIVSPHMAGLAAALTARGVEVTYVAERTLSPERAAQGWQAPDLGGARLLFAADRQAIADCVAAAPSDSIHLCQGLRGNGLVGFAQEDLGRRGLRQWVIMETVDDAGWRGVVKRMEYRRLLRAFDKRIEGMLAIGHTTSDWLVRLGMPTDRVFSFAYFLPSAEVTPSISNLSGGAFRFLFVGQLTERKRLDLLIHALETTNDLDFELSVAGVGPLEDELAQLADQRLGKRVQMLGRVPQDEVSGLMANSDCLVLPSRHDGWGAVVSEALMVGTEAICSDCCGAATAVLASGRGGVFPAGDAGALSALIRSAMAEGRNSAGRRKALVEWARCLNADAGAEYLERILKSSPERRTKPAPPWCEALGGFHDPERLYAG